MHASNMPIVVPPDLEPLVLSMQRDARRLVVMIGAGVSVGATSASHASWPGLLNHAVDHLVSTSVLTGGHGQTLRGSLDAAFHPFDLATALKHAEFVELALTTPNRSGFSDWLGAAFQNLKAQEGKTATLDALRDLQQAGALLLTTNYDSLLSDATGLPTVTWEDHARLYEATHGDQPAIVHVHGHWAQPSSVVLGRSSYERIVGDEDFQQIFRSLWLERSWLYVGCGDGLDDPNVGRLLAWGNRWPKSAPPDYFLTRNDTAANWKDRQDRPAHLVPVGYNTHDDLPDVLRSITPSSRRWPFVRVDDDFALFRPAASRTIPVPSRKEFLEDAVPALAADAELEHRLEQHGWAFVLDVASVGKTTLAMRVASAPGQRTHDVYYLDLAGVDGREAVAAASAAMPRLTRSHVLLIVDNIHHQPELARKLWDQWRDHPRGSRLLLLGTRMHSRLKISATQDLAFFEHHPVNPAIELRPTPADLGRILQYLYARFAVSNGKPLRPPPPETLEAWHRDYGSSLGAFCIAALDRLPDFQREKWELPIKAASNWVRERWLADLDGPQRDNLLCLAVYGAQDLELLVRDEALPHPGQTDRLRELLIRNDVGALGQHHWYGLREPSWGRLVLAAQDPPVDEAEILYATAARDPMMASSLARRLRRNGDVGRIQECFAYIAQRPDDFIRRVVDMPLARFPSLIEAVTEAGQPQLVDRLWEAMDRDRATVVSRAYAGQLDAIPMFMSAARRCRQDVDGFWTAFEAELEQFSECALNTPLDKVAAFVESAKRQKRDVKPLWAAIERERGHLAARIWIHPLDVVAAFLDTATAHERDVRWIWEKFEHEPARVAARAWASPLDQTASFMETAKSHKRNVGLLWDAIERGPRQLIERAWDTPLEHVASFLEVAKRHQRNLTFLWEVFEADPGRRQLIERAWETPLEHIASFLDVAKRHQRDFAFLWEALEADPERLAVRAWSTPLDHLSAFLSVARYQGRDSGPLWDALEREPARLSERAGESSIEKIASFLSICRRDGRDPDFLVKSLASRPDELSAKARIASFAHLAGFCHRAPDDLVHLAFRDVKPGDWDSIPLSTPMLGATGVARRCASVGRDDLRQSIVETLLRRANPHDFPPQSMAFGPIDWLLTQALSVSSAAAASFLDALCTPKWLSQQYNRATCSNLAPGLRALALHQRPQVVQRFYNRTLKVRIAKELGRFGELTPREQSAVIQLVGAAALCGWTVGAALFDSAVLAAIARLPADALPHRSQAIKVEDWQWQLWLGLRAVTNATHKRLPLPTEIIVQTRDLWHVNLAETAATANSVEHRLNGEMVTWLTTCAARGRGLIPTVS
jgi:hypothetical protein